jgi:hypothetical protein
MHMHTLLCWIFFTHNKVPGSYIYPIYWFVFLVTYMMLTWLAINNIWELCGWVCVWAWKGRLSVTEIWPNAVDCTSVDQLFLCEWQSIYLSYSVLINFHAMPLKGVERQVTRGFWVFLSNALFHGKLFDLHAVSLFWRKHLIYDRWSSLQYFVCTEKYCLIHCANLTSWNIYSGIMSRYK